MDLPDYTTYTFRQLIEALNGIRGDLYPEALSALEAEVRTRQDVSKVDLEEAYFSLDHKKHPEQSERLAALIREGGGFDTIAPETITSENRYQTGWRRVWALVFDVLILQVLFSAVSAPVLAMQAGDVVINTAVSFVAQTLFLLYFILMHSISGQTLGKMITGVRVVRNRDEERISLRHALLRDSVPLVLLVVAIVALPNMDIVVGTGKNAPLKPPGPVNLVALLSVIWGLVEILSMIFSKKRRALHDLIAGTVVVRHLRSKPFAKNKEPAPRPAGTQVT